MEQTEGSDVVAISTSARKRYMTDEELDEFDKDDREEAGASAVPMHVDLDTFRKLSGSTLNDREGASCVKLCVSDLHSRNMRLLERKASHIQYLLACLSTLGGANHLCNKPAAAMQLAIRQEYLGRVLGSTQIVIRAQVFQAVNWALLGSMSVSLRCFRMLLKKAKANEDAIPGLVSFVRASLNWLKMEFSVRNKPTTPLVTEFSRLCSTEESL